MANRERKKNFNGQMWLQNYRGTLNGELVEIGFRGFVTKSAFLSAYSEELKAGDSQNGRHCLCLL